MGQRANLIVVREDGYDLHYSHWRANRLECDLFWGPDHALEFIRRQRLEAGEDGWLDDVWAEGGALIDPPRSRLLWWGGESILHDVPMRRVLLALMERAWPGWEIAWAHEGIADLADHVGFPRERVLTAHETCAPALDPIRDWTWANSVLSARRADGSLACFPLEGDIEDRLWDCDTLVRMLALDGGHSTLDLRERVDEFPYGGAHVDCATREVTFWTAQPRPDVAARLAAANPTWSIRWHRDRYEAQLEACGPALSFPDIDHEAIIERLHAKLMAPDRDFTNYLAEVVAIAHPGEDVDINPYALRDDPLPVSAEDRERIWSEVLGGWRSARER